MYQALYRQYRPKTFDQVLGQEHITVTLKNQIKNGNISHAYLFAGTKGTGKTSTAKIFSRAVNCPNSLDGNPCNECPICKGIMSETIMDVIEMDAASNRKIEDIRDLKDKVVYPPSKTKYKIYIIDEVHMLTNEAFNALLKTLEEPPAHLIFILATTEMEKLPQTILSRCQRFDFKRIASKDLVENMETITDDIGVKVDPRALRLIARNSDGAMRDALSLLDQCVAYSDNISYEDALDILGIANMELLFDLVDLIKEKDSGRLLLQIDEIIQEGKDVGQFIKDLIVHFRNLLLIKSSNASMDIMDMDQEAFENYRLQGEKFSVDFILRALDILAEAESKGKWASQPRIILEMSLIKLVKLEENLPLLERIERLEERIESGKLGSLPRETRPRKSQPEEKPKKEEAPRREKAPEKTVEESPKAPKKEAFKKVGEDYSLEELKGQWPSIMEKFRKESIQTYAFMVEGKLYDFNNNTIIVVYDEKFKFHRDAIDRDSNRELAEALISDHLNQEVSLRFLMSHEVSDRSQEEEVDVKKDIVDFFGPDIVDIK